MGTSFMALVIAGSGVPHPDIPGFMGNESLTFPPAPERSPGGGGGGGGGKGSPKPTLGRRWGLPTPCVRVTPPQATITF